ncbi:MAG: type I methionyl aminopeptidase [Actinomycetota bacterium]|nr:type I methionyl aminopeptidase [Actinomycetota bacterium]
MIHYKSASELAKMRRSARILADTILRVMDAVAPGRSTADLDAVADELIRAAGAVSNFKGYRGTYPATICTSVNDEIVHGIPSATRVLAEGDLLSLDFGCIWEGFHSDSAVSLFVGGVAPSPEAERLVKVTEAALDAAVAAVVPGARLSDIGAAIEGVATPEGLGIVREYGGHGIGRAMHEDPFIQNYGPAGRGPALKPGLTVALEPMLNLGGEETRLLADDWTVVTADGSLSAHFEHTVAVTEDGHEILTARG